MTDLRAAYDPDRLPWLADERAPVAVGRGLPLLPILWSVMALLLATAAFLWLGTRTVEPASTSLPAAPTPRVEAPASTPPAAELPVVEPAPPPPASEVAPQVAAPPAPLRRIRREPERARTVAAPEPDSAPVAASETETPADTASIAETAPDAASTQPEKPAPQAHAAAPLKRVRLQHWPAAVSEGASGRVVRIGTFSSRLQAKKAWWKVVKVYPGMKRLHAVVAPVPSARNGRTYYRLQFGTTSQAHSTVLCQRMRIVGQSCVVVGL